MSFSDTSNEMSGSPLFGDFGDTANKVQKSTSALGISASAFAKTMTKAFSDATTGGKQFDDVLRQLALRLSSMAVTNSFQPLIKNALSGLGSLFGNISGSDGSGEKNQGGTSRGPIQGSIANFIPFASGGVIGTPSYFPLASGGMGLAGEAGPEAIIPLARGSDGQLGVAMSGRAQAPNITIQIAAPDPSSFRRSEAYITGQIARAVARGQRGF
jgi:lambda family phage tail tape measure protein